MTPVAACATGVANLASGARLLGADGLAAVICGGAESSLHPAVAASMRSMGIIDAQPMRPFDTRRGGFNLGEGGGLLVLEPAAAVLDSSERHLLAWLTGARLFSDAHHMTDLHSRRQTLTRLMRDLFRHRSQLLVSHAIEKLYVNAHATATRLNDVWETAQIIDAFGPGGWAREEGWIAPDALVVVSGTKSMTGHLLGASATLEAVICVAVLNGAPPPPTLNLIEPHDPWPQVLRQFDRLQLLSDPAADWRVPVRSQDAGQPFDAALSLNYGFGGHVGGVLFERADA
ncbi:MAG TPA: beta-ketoacyl synthase N-terminal-like domain-containing protein [Planctomycetota bacterium]|nr:beta-ketoacyl synthase N-terminal-like domain-containing protein [Planctomycetota bacterium]